MKLLYIYFIAILEACLSLHDDLFALAEAAEDFIFLFKMTSEGHDTLTDSVVLLENIYRTDCGALLLHDAVVRHCHAVVHTEENLHAGIHSRPEGMVCIGDLDF